MSSPTPPAVEVAVIGAGPAGLTAALVLGRQKRTVVLVDAGQPRNAPATEMHMYLGFDGRPPEQLRGVGMDEVAAHPNVEIVHTTVSGL
ncbi:MAG: FAD-dependent oxidoreductase, partial [Dietzia cercidiphylli]